MITEAGEKGFGSPNYRAIDVAEEQQLVEKLIGLNPEIASSDSKYCLLTVDGQSEFSNLGRALEAKRFNEFFENTPEEMIAEYGPYERASKFFIMADREAKRVAGVMRIIEPNEAGHKSVNDLATEKTGEVTSLSVGEIYGVMGIKPAETLDVATIASSEDYSASTNGNDTIVRAALMRAVYEYGHEKGFSDLVAIIDDTRNDAGKSPLKILMSVNLPIHTTPYVPRFPYLGAGQNEFIHIPLSEVEASVSAKDPGTYSYVFGDLALAGECVLSFSEQ